MSNTGSCDVCQKLANQKCGGCHQKFYCSKEHQKTGWKSHKLHCRPFKVSESGDLGRFLITTKPIKAGEIVLKERPLIYGPSQATIPVCLGCGKAIDEKNAQPCSECGWPMCSEICQKNPCHIPECRYTAQRGEKVSIRNYGMIHPIYQCITVLRCLYQKQFLKDIWDKLDKLQSHCEERKSTQKYRNERFQVAEFIRRFFKLDQVFCEDDIMRICGILMVNSHEVPLAEPPYIAIYEFCSMFEHSCRPNCSKSFANDGSVIIVAGEEIPKDSHLSICYTDPLWGTPNRRYHLYETKFFWCTCTRCSDPTEFGTYFSALKCQEKNCNGFLLPRTFLEKTDNTKESNWKCNECGKTTSCFTVQHILEKLGSEMTEIAKDNTKDLRKFIDSSKMYLHSNHYYLTEMRLALIQAITQENNESNDQHSDEELDFKARTSSELLNLCGNIAPAERRLRGTVLFELHAAVAEIARRCSEPGTMHIRLMEARSYLEECVEFLKYEPSCLPEGQILIQAKQNLKNIDIVLQKLHESMGPT